MNTMIENQKIYIKKDELKVLESMAESECWDYWITPNKNRRQILWNYVQKTFQWQLRNNYITNYYHEHIFDTGLQTKETGEPIYGLFEKNFYFSDYGKSYWYLKHFYRHGAVEIQKYGKPTYHSPKEIMEEKTFNPRVSIAPNLVHIIEENKDRFPQTSRFENRVLMENIFFGSLYLTNCLVSQGNFSASIQFYQNSFQFLLPLFLITESKADAVVVLEPKDNAYIATTILSPDMAYNNARFLGKVEEYWLLPPMIELDYVNVSYNRPSSDDYWKLPLAG